MSTLAQATGIILHRVRHGETSLIVTAFTREAGRLGLMAKGARSKSKLSTASGLELFNEAQFVYYHKHGRDLQLLKEWSVVVPHSALREDFERLTVASAVVELLSRCLKDDDPHPELYDAATKVLAALDERPTAPLIMLWAFELDLFSTLGFTLQFARDIQNGQTLTPPFRGPIRYRLSDGSFLHPDNPVNLQHDGLLSAEVFSILTRLSGMSVEFISKLTVSTRAHREIAAFLARYLETHLPVKGRLRSLDALGWDSTPTPD
jgi:DNA repair protein RecO (recombination protein O)